MSNTVRYQISNEEGSAEVSGGFFSSDFLPRVGDIVFLGDVAYATEWVAFENDSELGKFVPLLSLIKHNPIGEWEEEKSDRALWDYSK